MDKWRNWAGAACLNTTPVQFIPLPVNESAIDHVISAIGSDMGYVPIGLSNSTAQLPGWFVRGLKGVVGEYVDSIGSSHWRNKQMAFSTCSSKTLSQISDSYSNTSNYCQTTLGQPVSRYMVAIKGLSQTLLFINQLQVKGSWTELDFENFLGMSFQEFEEKSKKYAELSSPN